MFGGLYIVPLYAIVQQRAEADYKARTIAANNVLNALFMVLGAAGAALLFAIGMTVTGIFLVIAAANVIAAYYVCKLQPTALMTGIAEGLLRPCCRVEVLGSEQLTAAGAQAAVGVIPLSFIVGAVLAACLTCR